MFWFRVVGGKSLVDMDEMGQVVVLILERLWEKSGRKESV